MPRVHAVIKRPIPFDEVVDKLREYLMNAETEGGESWRDRLDNALADLRVELCTEEDSDAETAFRLNDPTTSEAAA
ncbi:hypothetical protein ASF34_00925 [Methylobacterium sp. Leaf106]|nr:hypothetical protein ASF34_00925 [Methylobacterium sp. Leaf106]